MSFGWTAGVWLTIASTATSIYSAQQQRVASSRANDIAKSNALLNQKASDEANNRANAKAPDSAASMASAMLAGRAGQSGTMLTGPQGVDPNLLTLGKNTLLGG